MANQPDFPDGDGPRGQSFGEDDKELQRLRLRNYKRSREAAPPGLRMMFEVLISEIEHLKHHRH